MIQPLSSFLSLQKSDYAIEVAMYVLIVLALGLTALFDRTVHLLSLIHI